MVAVKWWMSRLCIGFTTGNLTGAFFEPFATGFPHVAMKMRIGEERLQSLMPSAWDWGQ